VSSRASRVAAAAGLFVLAGAVPAGGAVRPAQLANHCFKVGALGRFYLKPTGLTTYLLYDRRRKLLSSGPGATTRRADVPDASSEWTLRRRADGRFAVRSKATRRALSHRPLRLNRAHGCRAYPEASVGATGKPFRGLRGFVDAHVHIPGALRGGGLVIAGENFHRYGVPDALGHDADVHGSDGSLDVTGNLLRSGQPTGTHDTHGWPTFTGWPTADTYTHQQIYYRWLERVWMDGERLVVAQTVEDESLCNIEPRKSHSCDETDTVEAEVRQLRALQDYVDAQSGGRGRGWFRLVYGPQAARRAIVRGKLAVIVGMETSDPFGCSESHGQPNCDRGDIDRGIARLRKIGVRTMFLAHWVDNALAGAALEGGDKGTFIATLNVAQTGEPFSTGPCPYPEQGEVMEPTGPEPVSGAPPVGPLGGRQCNTRGLTDLGEYAVRQLMDNHMLIEVDHLSEWARQRVLAIAEERHYPLVSSHTGTGGLWTADELSRLYGLGGFATATIDDASKLPGKILAFRRFGGGVGLGTDTGGFNALPAPAADAAQRPLKYPFRAYSGTVRLKRQRTGQRTFDVNKDGVAHYGLLPDLLANVAREKQGRSALDLLFKGAGAYLRTWRLTGAK
jgi:microsomal dipeptidase-like Zn-dependent dipeptidase